MKKSYIALIMIVSLLIAGCPARSLQPLFTEKEKSFNPALIGTWAIENETYTFAQASANSYTVSYYEYAEKSIPGKRQAGDSATYVVHLGKIGEHWFFDSYPIKNASNHHLLSTHIFSQMSLEADTLRFAPLEADWLSKMIKAGTIKISHTMKDDDIILTASTEELQELMRTIGGNSEAFPNPGKLVRVK